jgi:Acetyl-CoA dehydrogenase C-terminal like
VALQHLVSQIEAFIESEDARPELADARSRLTTALDDLQAWVNTMTGYLVDSQQSARELYRVGLESVRFLLAVGDLLIGWLLLRHAEIALAALDGDPAAADRSFYNGKVAAAKFFVNNMLPRLTADRGIAANVDLAIMDLREEAF